MAIICLFAAIALLSLSQVLQKLAADRAKDAESFYSHLARQRLAWLAVACLALGMLLWLLTLSYFEISKVYPLLSLTFVFTTLYSAYYLKERLTHTHKLGVVFIFIGVSLIGAM